MIYIKQQIDSIDDTDTADLFDDWDIATPYIVEEDLDTLTNASTCRYGAYYYVAITPSEGKQPDLYVDTYWMKWKISNKWACLDLNSLSKSETIGGSLYYTFLQNRTLIDFAIGNFTAETLLFEVLDTSDTVVYSYETDKVSIRNISNWYNWTYRELDYTVDRTIYIKSPIVGNKVRITFKDSLAVTDTSVGYIFGGLGVDMGKTINKIPFGFNSYSSVTTDDFGSMKIVERAKQDIVDFQTTVKNDKFISKRRQIKADFDKVVAFILDNSDNSIYENLVVLGKMQNVTPILETHDELQVLGWSVVEVV